MEPRLNEKVICALHAGNRAITCPYEMTIACAENARQNGVQFIMNAPVRAIKPEADGFLIRAGESDLCARYVINAAGVYADDVSRLIGDDSYSVFPRKGEYMLLDKSAGGFKKVIFQTPSKLGKGVLVSPTVDGNAFAGPPRWISRTRPTTRSPMRALPSSPSFPGSRCPPSTCARSSLPLPGCAPSLPPGISSSVPRKNMPISYTPRASVRPD